MRVWFPVIVLFVGATALGGDPPKVAEADLVGIWKLGYEPGLTRVHEPSEGYLVLMPGGRYFEQRHDCCKVEPPVSREGTYTVSGDTVVLSGGRTRRFVRAASVVLFDNLLGEPTSHPVLALGNNLNFCFARVYPVPARVHEPFKPLPAASPREKE